MDPLSMTVSVVTLITVAGSILQHLEHVRSRMNPNGELLAIMNTVGCIRSFEVFYLTPTGNGFTSDFGRSAR